MSRRYSDADLIKILQEKAKKLGRPPKRREVKQNYAVTNHFGSWNQGLVAAGLKPLKKTGLTKHDYKRIILDWAKTHGRTPRQEDFYTNPFFPDPRSICRKWGKSWTNIMLELGLEPNQSRIDREYTEEELFEIFKEEYTKNNPKDKLDYDKKRVWGTPSLNHTIKKTGLEWNDLLKKIGVPSGNLTVYSYTDEELISKLQDIAADLSHTPSIPELEEMGYPYTAAKDHFGSYNNTLAAAGLELNQKTPDVVRESDEELLKMYKDFSRKLGKPATTNDLNRSNEIYNADVFMVRFGNMYNLKIAAGYEAKYRVPKYSMERIRRMLAVEHKKAGHRLTNNEIRKNSNLPALSTILRYFRTTSIAQVWEEVERYLCHSE